MYIVVNTYNTMAYTMNNNVFLIVNKAYTNTHTHIYIHTHTHTLTHLHTYIHEHTCTHTHIHTNTIISVFLLYV